MEPIGAAASLITLLAVSKNIADRGLVLIRRYRGYSAAKAVVRDRLLQLEVQLSLLSDVQKTISDSNILSDDARKKQLLETITNTRVTFESIRDFLAQHSEQGGTRARLRWARKDEADVQDWIEKLAQHRQSLSSLLNALQFQLSAHSLRVSKTSDIKLALLVKNQDEEKKAKIVARSRELRNRNEKINKDSDAGVLWGLLFRLPTDIRYLTFLRSYTFQFSLSVLYRPINQPNIVPDSAEIFESCKSGDALGVKQLLDAGKASPFDTTTRGWTPLRFAIESGSKSLVQLLLDYGADPETCFGQIQTSPIAWAFAARKIDIARFLHSRGADLDSPNLIGWTPLFYVFGSIGSPEIQFPFSSADSRSAKVPPAAEYLQFLSSASLLDVNAHDRSGWTSLHRAAIHGQGSDILEFVRVHASLSPRTKFLQWTPIFVAVNSCNFSTFTVLADHQPGYCNETDIQGWTLLHVAAEHGCKEILTRLLRDGADVHALSDARATRVPDKLRGKQATPLDVARAIGGKTFVMFLVALCMWDEEVRVVWEGDECDVFFPSVTF
ncbi:ankyrin repeat-containing domain protein [Cadophora sp. MPI-SDFR-AT-0126]|nr:ankyrin repeat-containing domain protein [Leotiomycetes sp. MPI-SDFR-AT-0126]